MENLKKEYNVNAADEAVKVEIKDEWCGNRFSDIEIKMLLAGKELKVFVENEIKIGHLEKTVKNGKEILEFKIGIPVKTAFYEWTNEEREKLYAGEKLYIEKFYNPKTCSYFAAFAKWDSNNRKIVLSEDENIKP